MSSAAGHPPPLSAKAVCKLVSRYFNVKSIVEDSVKSFPSYDDRNYYLRGELTDSKCTEFVLKLGNPVYCSFPMVKGLNKLLHHINSRGLRFATPFPLFNSAGTDILSLTAEQLGSLPMNGVDTKNLTVNGKESSNSDGMMEYPVRLLSFIPGKLFDAVEKEYLTPAVLKNVGETLASIDKELKENFSDELFASRKNPYWDLMFFSNVKQFLGDVDNLGRRSKAEIVFRCFEEYVMPKVPSFTRGIIHSDFNGLNIIIDKMKTASDSYQVTGIIDFGDCIESCTIFDLGICLAYIMLENVNPFHCSSAIEFVGPVIQGYHAILPLNSDEFDSLYYLVLARCIQSAIMGVHSFKAEPWNTYLLTTPEKTWTVVDLLLSTKKEEVDTIWKKYLYL